MKRLVAALALLCACRETGPIERERFLREPTTELTGIAMEEHAKWTRPLPPPICEVGAKKPCWGVGVGLPRPRGIDGPDGKTEILYLRCMQDPGGRPYWNNGACNTPLVVAFDDAPIEFTPSNAPFPIGLAEETEWVSAKTPWVALDRDGSGCIENERELFAGFGDLAELDANGDGRIDARDPAFAELVLWADRDQDKQCTPNELTPLSDRLDVLPLTYLRHEPFEPGSYEGETASLPNGARLVDVHLSALP